ncbi:helix-turn-helix transcriptional regulator [Sphingomonas sp. NFX23]|uniref:helix-turn-helix transcriptional regulator n=1 Tax=Sphingomonas sp. NFX23 TaxID=2819532 RepID=UPI003CF97683
MTDRSKDRPVHTAAAIDRLLRLRDVSRVVGFSRSKIYKMIRNGQFPAPYKPGGASSRWSEMEIAEWIDGVKAAGDKETGA